MELVLVRHGKAEPRDSFTSDHERALTADGVEQTKAAAKGLAKLIDPPDRVLTSDKTRAFQTAELVAKPFKQTPEPWPLLGDGEPESIGEAVNQRAEARLMLVGHEPTFSELIEWLCYGQAFGQTDMKKCGCAILDLTPGPARPSAVLEALLPPKVLRATAGKR